MKIRILFFALLISLNVIGQLSKTISFTYEEGKSKMLKENIRLMAEYYNLDIAEAEIQQKRLWDNPLFVWNAEMYSIAENNYFNFANQKLLQLEYSFSVSGKRINAIKEARIAKEIAQFALSDVMRGLVLEYSNAFYEFIELQEMNILLIEAASQYDRLIEQYTLGSKLGINSESELVRLKAEKQTILKDINENEKELLALELNLRMLMNYRSGVKLLAKKDISLFSPKISEDQLVDSAMNLRPDLKIAQKNISLYQATLKKEKSEIVPNINLGYQPHDQGSNHVRPYVGMVFEMGIPIFNRNQGSIAKAKIQIDQSSLLMQYKTEEVRNEVLMAMETFKRTQELKNSFNLELIDQMEVLSKNAKLNYENKYISLYEYIDFQRSYIENKLNYIQSNRKFNEAINLMNFVVGMDLKNL
ncbi:MAG: TolC family protein [Crocinitomicaceae bacterium]|nr:TolC family protein [Crocinitomicaceae bacterium]